MQKPHKMQNIKTWFTEHVYQGLAADIMSTAQMALEIIFLFWFIFAVYAMELCFFATLNTNVT